MLESLFKVLGTVLEKSEKVLEKVLEKLKGKVFRRQEAKGALIKPGMKELNSLLVTSVQDMLTSTRHANFSRKMSC